MSRASSSRQLSVERFTAFVDAVVAIAMTLLILPLMEAVSDASGEHLSTLEFLGDHRGQLISFALSFALIAMFWMEHHRVYGQVRSVTAPLVVINVAWLFTIVWLPVATAMVGQMPFDSAQAAVYIGSLIATQLLTLTAKAYLLRHPQMHEWGEERMRSGIIGDTASTLLFGVALALAVTVPGIAYASLLLTALTWPVSLLIRRILRRDTPARTRG